MSEQPNLPNTPARNRLLLPLILLIFAVLIRVPGLTWGLKDSLHNQTLHPDEEWNFRVSRTIEPARLQFAPGFYDYGTLYLTALRVAGDVAFAYGGGSDHLETDWDAIRRGELAGRVVSLIAGSLLCVVVFFTARRFTSDVGAFAAGLTLAVAPALVVHSRFATVDIFATLFVALAGLYAIRLLMDEDPPWMKLAILAGVCAGLSAGTKYSGFLSLVMPLAALGIRRPPKFVLLMAMATLASVVAFVVSTPGCVLDSARFIHDVKFEFAHSRAGHGMVFAGTSNGFFYHLANLCLGVGTVLTFLGFGALVWALVRKQKWAWVLLAFAIPYYITIGGAEVKFMRYVFPVTIAVAAGVGFVVGEGHRLKKGYGALVALGILGIGGIEGGGLRGTWFFTNAMVSQDNREQAAVYIKSNSNESTVAGLIDNPWFWSPTLYPDITMGNYMGAVRQEKLAAATDPKVTVLDFAALPTPLPDYIAYSDFESLYVETVMKLPSIPDDFAADVARHKQVQDLLTQHYKADKQFGDATDMVEDMRYVMPAVYVWKRQG